MMETKDVTAEQKSWRNDDITLPTKLWSPRNDFGDYFFNWKQFLSWSRSIKIALDAKVKLAFTYGKI